jgi:integrase
MPNLDNRTILAAQPKATPYRLFDGKGLFLVVKPSGAKAWFVRVQVAGKRHDVGLGGFPAFSLREAREKAEAMRKQARAGIDPIEEREAARREREAARKALEEAQARTFRRVAEACIAAQEPGWKDRKTAVMWRGSLKRWAYPEIGDMPVAEIDRTAVMRAISAVWRERPATAKKVLRRIGAVLRYAAAHGLRANDNPADAKMLRNMGLPALPGGRNLPSLPWARLPAFWAALDKVEGMGAAALRFAILTALRSKEVRLARWSWLDFSGPVPTLTVPGEVMKGKRSSEVQPHRVPLAPAALEVLARAYREATGLPCTVAELPKRAALAGEALIFPSATRRTPISDMTMSAVVRRLNADRPRGAPPPWRDADGREAVPHGFRSAFSTWIDDVNPAEREAAEKALAHEVPNKVSGAYRRSDLFERRVSLMAAWAEHVTSALRGARANVAPVPTARRRVTRRDRVFPSCV